MDSSITEELKRTFELVSLRHESSTLRTASDWERGRDIISRHQKEAEKQEKLYREQYDARVRKAMTQLIDKAGAKNRHFTHRWFGTDRFDKDVLQRQARRMVKHDYLVRKSRLAQSETEELKELMREVKQRDRLHDKPTQDFQRATDRRSGKERRQQSDRPLRRQR